MSERQDTRKLKVLLAGALYPEISASAILVSQLAEELQRIDDVDVTVVDLGRIRGGGMAGVGRYVRALWRMAAASRRSHIMCLYINRTALAFIGPPALLIARLTRTALIIRTLGGKSYLVLEQPARAVARWVVRHADLYLLQTKKLIEEVRADGIEHLDWYPNSRPVPAEQPPPRDACRRFVHLGRLYEKKGVRDLIEAAEESDAGITVDVYGPFWYGDFDADVFEGAKHVNYCGSVPPKEVPHVLSSYDALVFPTYDPTEGHPGIILEAFSVGLPVICTRVGGIPEIVDNECAIIVEPRDVKGLREAMEKLQADSALYQRLRKGALEKRAEFSSSVWARRFVDTCRGVLSRKWGARA